MLNISRIDLNLFVILNAIYTEGGVTRASERLNLTQSAISHALGRLRELLNDPLFTRDGQAMVPTATTLSLIEPIRRALNEIEASLGQLNQFDPLTSKKHFRVGMRHIVEYETFPKIVSHIRKMAPGVQLSTVLHDRDKVDRDLASGALDAVVDVRLPKAPNVSSCRVANGHFVVALRKDHPMVGETLDLETYLALEHVLATSRRQGPGLEDRALMKLGHERKVVVRCQHYWTACQIVAQTDLAATIPEYLANRVNAVLGNRILAFPLQAPASDLFLYWHSNAENDPTNRWLREQMLACMVKALISPL